MLPKIKSPSIPLTLPTKEKEEIVLRHLTTADYKTIMSAVNSNNIGIFLETVKDVIQSAVIKPKEFSIDKYPAAIIDWLYLNIYKTSISGNIEVALNCKNTVPKVERYQELNPETGLPEDKEHHYEGECGTKFSMPVSIHEVTISDAPVKKVFELEDNNGETIYLKLKLPTWETWHRIVERSNLTVEDISADNEGERDTSFDKELETMYAAIYDCLDGIFIGDEPLEEEPTFAEFCEWLDSFPPDTIKEFKDFIEGLPQVYYKQQVTCPSCGFTQEFRLMGLSDFLK